MAEEHCFGRENGEESGFLSQHARNPHLRFSRDSSTNVWCRICFGSRERNSGSADKAAVVPEDAPGAGGVEKVEVEAEKVGLELTSFCFSVSRKAISTIIFCLPRIQINPKHPGFSRFRKKLTQQLPNTTPWNPQTHQHRESAFLPESK